MKFSMKLWVKKKTWVSPLPINTWFERSPIFAIEGYSELVLVFILQHLCNVPQQYVCQTDRMNSQWFVSLGVRVHSWIDMLSLV